jgi:predicted flavoprotein YhiN
VAGQLGLRVVLIDHSARVAEKSAFRAGAAATSPTPRSAPRTTWENPRFAKSALARYTPRDFVELVRKHGIGFHEKHKGQLFCDRSAQDLIDMLLAECAAANVSHWQPCTLHSVRFWPPAPME